MAVSALAVAMIELSFGASLVPLIGAAALPPPGFGAAGFAAVALSPVAVPADPEDSVAADNRTNTLTKDHLAMKIHLRPGTGLDNGDRSWQVKNQFDVWLPAEGCQTERPDRANGPGTRWFSPSSTKNFISSKVDDRRMICACGADDVVRLYTGESSENDDFR